MTFRNILLSAIMVGIISGLAYGLFQQSQISPIIFAAEVYEVAEEPTAFSEGHSHAIAEPEAWGPKDGPERTLYTYSADVAAGIAFALVMISLMALHNLKANKPKLNALTGAAWGIAAMLSLFVSPALFGLHPEVPGTEAAALEARQLWWVLCVAASLLGVAFLYYSPLKLKPGGFLIAAIPHLVGAPLPEHHGFANTAPDAVKALSELSIQFYSLTAVGMLVFYLLVGSLSGAAVKRFVKL